MLVMNNDHVFLVVVIIGYIIGLGATTVIDMLGLLGVKSTYWTTITIATHKITKPLILIGAFIKLVGDIFLLNNGIIKLESLYWIFSCILYINGLILSLVISPILLKLEKEHTKPFLLPNKLQLIIALQFVISAICWWGSLLLLLFNL